MKVENFNFPDEVDLVLTGLLKLPNVRVDWPDMFATCSGLDETGDVPRGCGGCRLVVVAAHVHLLMSLYALRRRSQYFSNFVREIVIFEKNIN